MSVIKTIRIENFRALKFIEFELQKMAFYLASWGMYRGSSFLLWKDYLIHKEVVKHILDNKRLQKVDYSVENDSHINEIFDLIEWIKNWYKKNINSINGVVREINVTDTLATKIVLGTLGCIPAYDRYFIDGIRFCKESRTCIPRYLYRKNL